MTNENGPVASRNEAASDHPISDEDTTSLLSRAIECAKRGWHVFPCEPNGKQPIGRLVPNGQHDATADVETVRDWWVQAPDANIGIACEPSGLTVLDLDRHPGQPDGYAAYLDLAGSMPETYTVRTPTGDGWHLYFERLEGDLVGKLAAGIDVKHNGYVLAAGSIIDGRPYEATRDLEPSQVAGWTAAMLRRPAPAPKPAPAGQVAGNVLDRVRQLAAELEVAPDGQGNATAARVAFMAGGYVGAGQLDHETAAAILAGALAGWTYRDPSHHERDERTIRSQLEAGARTPRPWIEPPSGEGLGFAGLAAPTSSWSAVDLTAVLDGTAVAVVPTIGKRADGAAILYPGKEHVVAGEPESGKTWLAISIVRDVLVSGGRVAYVDFEDDETTVVGRMKVFGMLRARFDPNVFRYVRPEVAPKPGELAALLDFPDGPADLVVFDGWTEGAGLLGLDIMSQDDITKWRRMLIKPCLAVGAATLTTDHVVKNKESRGRGPIGANHKLAGLTGACFLVEAKSTWGKGSKGRSRVLVSKDRNGGLRSNGVKTNEPNITHFGDLIGDAEGGDMKSVVLYKPLTDDERDNFTKSQREAIARVSDYFAKKPEPITKAALKAVIGGNLQAAGEFVECLVVNEFVTAKALSATRSVYSAGPSTLDTEES